MNTAEKPVLEVFCGPPRVGKDTVVNEITSACQAQGQEVFVLSTDEHIRGPLWADSELETQARLDLASDTDSLERALFQQKFDNEIYTGDESWIPNILNHRVVNGGSYFTERSEKQIEAVWQLGNMPERIHEFMAAPEAGKRIVQGLVMLPRHIKELRETNEGAYNIEATYLCNLNLQTHTEATLAAVQAARETDPNQNWMAKAGWSDERITAYMKASFPLQLRRANDASFSGHKWVNMGHGSFKENVRQIVARSMALTAIKSTVA